MLLLSSADFLKSFFKKFFQELIRLLKGLDPDQEACSVGPDLDPNCLICYHKMTKVAASKETVKKKKKSKTQV